jgi:hypothetical protein
MSKLKHYAECLEGFLNRTLVVNEINFWMYIDRIMWLIVQNIWLYLSHFPHPPLFNDDNLHKVFTRMILAANT